MTAMTEEKIDGKLRDVVNCFRARSVSDGDGVRMLRAIGTETLPMLDPFLLLDEFRSSGLSSNDIPGFPDHPHRGFETVTYMIAGRMRHKDGAGHVGTVEPGGVQWMTAGRGIVHSETPEAIDGSVWGFQLWINLAAAQKMQAPRYEEFAAADVPEVSVDGGARVRVIAGNVNGVEGAVRGIPTDPYYLDIVLPPHGHTPLPAPGYAEAFLYVYEGIVQVGGPKADAALWLLSSTVGVLGKGTAVQLRAGPSGARVLLLAARPLDEPVVRRGPFVMNTHAELVEAFDDYRDGRL